MRKRRTEANRRFVKFISLFFFLSLPGSSPGGEKQSQESYGKTQATRNEGQNPCASKDAAAGAAVAETCEGQAEQEVRGDEREETNEKKQRHLRRKGEVQKREAGEKEKECETRRACKGEKQRRKERKREKGKERLA